MPSESAELYVRLSAPFDHTEAIVKGGEELHYLSGRQVTERLTEVLGADNWAFQVLRDGRDDNSLWCVGRLTVYFPGRTVVREQFGECTTTKGMGPGDARKGAATDALKKCASLVGVGLYLQRDPEPDASAGNTSIQSTPRNSEIVRNQYGLPKLGVSDSLAANRKAEMLAWVKNNLDMDEQDMVFAMGRSIEEWCRQHDTGYLGALSAYTAFVKARSLDTSIRMIGSTRPRESEPT